MAQCKRMLPSGERCSNRAVPGTDYCEAHGRIQFRPVSEVPAVAPPADEPAVRLPEWVARPSAAGQAPALAGLRADGRNILVAPQGCVWLSATGGEGPPASLYARLVRLLSALSHEMALPGQVVVRVEGGQGALIRVRPPDPAAADLSRLYDAVADAAALSGGLLYVGEGRAFIQYRDGAAPRGYDVAEGETRLPDGPAERLYLVDRQGTHPLDAGALSEVPLDELLLHIAPLPAAGAALPAAAYVLSAPALYGMLARYFRAHDLRYRVARFYAPAKGNAERGTATYMLFEVAPRPDAPTGALLPAFVRSYVDDLPRCVVLGEAWAEEGGRRMLVEWGRMYPCHPPHVLDAFAPGSLLLFSADPDFDNLCVSPAPAFFEGDEVTAVHAPRARRVDLVPHDGREGLPLEVPLRLVADQGALPATAALILEGPEMTWLRRLLYRLPGEAFAGYRVCMGRERAVLVGEGLPITSLPFGIPLRRVRDTPLFVPLRARLTPDLPWALLAEALALDEDDYVFMAPAFRLDVPRDDFAPLSRALMAEPGRPRVTLAVRPSSTLPALRFTPPPERDEPALLAREPVAPVEAAGGDKRGLFSRLLDGERPPSGAGDVEPGPSPAVVAGDEDGAQALADRLRAEAESLRSEGRHLDAALYFALAGDQAAAGRCYQQGAHALSEE